MHIFSPRAHSLLLAGCLIAAGCQETEAPITRAAFAKFSVGQTTANTSASGPANLGSPGYEGTLTISLAYNPGIALAESHRLGLVAENLIKDVPEVITVGRRTGRSHTIEIWYAAAGRTLYLLAGGRERADWVRNLRAMSQVEVRLAGRRYAATARVLDGGTDEDVLARRLLLAKYQAPGADDLEHRAETALAVALDV